MPSAIDRTLLAALAAALLTLGTATAASARTYVSRYGGTVYVRGGAADESVFMAGGFIKRPAGGLYARHGCENPIDPGFDFGDPSDDRPDRTMVRCGSAMGWKVIDVALGGGDDSWGVAWGYSRPRMIVSGGSGDDVIRGYEGRDRLRGGPGRDRINGEAGRDVIYARDGRRDVVDGGDGSDVAHVDRGDVVLSAVRVFH
jgi:Ca2+-binding RTX toxin-like protein